MPNPSIAERDPTVARVGEAALRMMAGAVPAGTLERLCRDVQQSEREYPWKRVVDAVLDDPVDPSELVQRGLVAQRDWVLAGGRETPAPTAARRARRKSLRLRGKTLLAIVLSRSLFFALYTATVVVLLILLKHQFPSFDIYVLLDGLREAFPGIFRDS